MGHLKPKPQGNAMLSVRITAAGAVFVCCLSLPTAPARACDDRYFNKCEKAAAAAAVADEPAGGARGESTRRGKRVRVVSTRSRHAHVARRRQAPRFATRLARGAGREEGAAPAVASDSPMARRFRGFIDPHPIAQNAFESLRKPRLMALDFGGSALLPMADSADVALPTPAPSAAPAPAATVATTPKQDRLIATPAALMELASAESRPVTLPPIPAVAPPPAQPVSTAPAIVTETPPAEPPRGNFSFHGLVLALCGALGAASALRFIVGA